MQPLPLGRAGAAVVELTRDGDRVRFRARPTTRGGRRAERPRMDPAKLWEVHPDFLDEFRGRGRVDATLGDEGGIAAAWPARQW